MQAYERHGSWKRIEDVSAEDLRKLRREKEAAGLEVQVLDCTIVKDAKLKNGKVIGSAARSARFQRYRREGTLFLHIAHGDRAFGKNQRGSRTSEAIEVLDV